MKYCITCYQQACTISCKEIKQSLPCPSSHYFGKNKPRKHNDLGLSIPAIKCPVNSWTTANACVRFKSDIEDVSLDVESSYEIMQGSRIPGSTKPQFISESETSGLTQLFRDKLVIQSQKKQVEKKEESKQMPFVD